MLTRDSIAPDRRSLLKGAAALLGLLGGPSRGAPPALAGAPKAPPTATSFATEIAPQVYAHHGQVALYSPNNEGDISNCGFIVGRDAVAVVDTGGSARVGTRLHDAIRTVTQLPIRYVINTHMHPDHVFGNASFEADQPAFVAHHKMARGLSARAERYIAINKEALGEEAFAGTKIVLPTLPISAPTKLDLGGREIVLTPQKTAHTDNDLIVRDSATGTLFLGDLVFSEHVPTLDGSILGWLSLLDAEGKEPAQRIVPGHGPVSMPWPDAAKPIRHYLQTIADEIRVLIKDNRSLSEATATVGFSEKSAWKLFADYHARNVSAAFAELEWE
ncbi:quinoprotein relay system zinc metallohydrolase 2 [Hyphomicrobium sp.]|uniref:quinoprotein relay system zinc metallohydrolase 2 n=1 Tax=Hyphomicrobium sp. TaxID=82 RepID=UPI002E2EDB3F|nr:quinoprotein relay system zinc metallohydrolase 2 [Hyphomicrobium sp.]HEX2841131.1 quinoprotein relay system zinc metallohydrolase 2 [Hyphomicrobium sp.]